MVEVASFFKTQFGEPGDIRCDRETKWGNPFILYFQKDRDKVCDLYKDYLDAIMVPNNQEMVKKMLQLGGLSEHQVSRWMEKTGGYLDISELFEARRLFCYCSPRRCHCEYLKRVIESKIVPVIDVDKR